MGSSEMIQTSSILGSSVTQHSGYVAFHTFGPLAFGVPLLCVAHQSRAGMGRQGLLWRGQGASAALDALPQGGRWAAGELCLSPGPIPALPFIFLSVSKKADGHREGQALLDGPPPPPGRFLLLLLFFSFLKDQNQ